MLISLLIAVFVSNISDFAVAGEEEEEEEEEEDDEDEEEEEEEDEDDEDEEEEDEGPAVGLVAAPRLLMTWPK